MPVTSYSSKNYCKLVNKNLLQLMVTHKINIVTQV